MISLSIQEKAHKEALHQIYTSSKLGIGGHLIAILIVAYMLMDKVSSGVILLGLIAHLTTLMGRTLLVIQYKKNQDTILDIKTLNRWQKSYLIGSFLTGLLWGLLPFFIGILTPEYHFLIFAIIIGLGGAGLSTLGLIFPIYLAYLLPMLGITTIWLFLQNETLYVSTALMTLLGIFYYLKTSKRFSHDFKEAYIKTETSKFYLDELRKEHDALVKSNIINHKLTERMELALTGSNTSIVDWNLTNNEFYLSPSWKEMLGYSDDELPNIILTWRERVHKSDKKNLFVSLRRAKNEKREYYENNHRLKHKDGHWVWILGRAQLLYDENGTAVRMVGTHADITKEKELQLKYSQQAQMIEQIHDSVISTDLEGTITSCNYGTELLLGYKSAELVGKHITMIYLKEDFEILGKNIEAVKQNGDYHTTIRLVKKSQEVIDADLSLSLIKDEKGNVIGLVGYSQDITKRKKAEAELLKQKDILDHQAHHDALTGLANRILFNDRLEQSLKKAKRSNTKIAVLFIDLDHFKEINDSLGHAVGDDILKIIASRLNGAIRNEDSIARLGGDEFVVMIDSLTQGQNASLLAQKILTVLAEPITLEGHILYVSSSIGISIYPDDGTNINDLLKFADAAMYKAKDEGRNNFQFYSSEMTELAFERVVMEASLRAALKNDDFLVYYQPQMDAKNDKLVGMEALVRWNHESMGIISPAKFIPLAETTGLIVELDQFVMRTAMKQMVRWYKNGLNPGKLALNLAVKQLQKKDFIDTLQNMLSETECKAEWVELEVTEGKIMNNPEEAIVVLNQISDIGIELAIDDFGTGYSSLSYIKKLPIHKLKIDQSFIRDLPNDIEDAAITKAVISLTQNLNLKVIAEGVETVEQKEFLLKYGCDYIQGYFYSKPVDTDTMTEILTKGFKT